MTVFVDPSQAINGNGTLASPYNTWAGIQFQSGVSYLQKRGTVSNAGILINQSGGVGTEIYIGAYFNADGSDNTSQPKPVIDLLGGIGNGLDTNGEKNIRVVDFIFNNADSQGLFVRNPPPNANIIVSRCEALDNVRHGFYASKFNDPVGSGVIFNNCKSDRNGQHGYQSTNHIGDPATVGVTYNYCTADNNGILGTGTGNGGHGFSAFGSFRKVIGGWTLVSGSTYSRLLSDTNVNDTTVHRVRDDDNILEFAENTATPTTPNATEFGVDAGILYINTSFDPNITNMYYAPAIVHVERYYCKSSNTVNPSGSFEGHGFAFDDSSQGVNQGCISDNNDGVGFTNSKTQFSRHLSCIATNNGMQGITLATSSGKLGLCEIENCVFENNGIDQQIHVQGDATNVFIRNNLFLNSERAVGTSFNFNQAITVDTNMFFNMVQLVTGNTVSVNDIVGDPQVNAKYKIDNTSIAYQAGFLLDVAQARIDANGQKYLNPPSIGAYEVVN